MIYFTVSITTNFKINIKCDFENCTWTTNVSGLFYGNLFYRTLSADMNKSFSHIAFFFRDSFTHSQGSMDLEDVRKTGNI